MNKSELALREACILAEQMCYEDLLKRFEESNVIVPEGQYERICKLIYNQPTTQKNDKKTISKKIKTTLLIAAILIILLSVSATAFSPLRDFFARVYKNCTEIVFNITSRDDYLFADYSYIPEGNIKVEDSGIKSAKSQSILYMNGKSIIKIHTFSNKDSVRLIDTENAETGEVAIDGSKGYYSITKTSIMLVWSTGRYNHCLTATLNKNITLKEVVKIAQSRYPLK